MRAFVLFVGLALGSAPALAQPIESGATLTQTCQAYVADETLKDHACKAFIVDFFTAYKQEQEERQRALVQGDEVDWSAPCFRMPDFVSFRDLAKLAIAKGQSDVNLTAGPAKDLLQATLVQNYPCLPVDQGDAPAQSPAAPSPNQN